MKYVLEMESSDIQNIGLGLAELKATSSVVKTINAVSLQVSEQNRAAQKRSLEAMVKAEMDKQPQ